MILELDFQLFILESIRETHVMEKWVSILSSFAIIVSVRLQPNVSNESISLLFELLLCIRRLLSRREFVKRVSRDNPFDLSVGCNHQKQIERYARAIEAE